MNTTNRWLPRSVRLTRASALLSLVDFWTPATGSTNQDGIATHEAPVPRVRPREGCGRARLESGSDVIDATHDYRNVPQGKVAFLRLPGGTQIDCEPPTASTSTLSLLAWKHNGKLVSAPSAQGKLVARSRLWTSTRSSRSTGRPATSR